MQWLLYLAVGYLLFSAIGAFVTFKMCPDPARSAWLAHYLQAYPIRMRLGLVLAVPTFPVILAHSVWTCWQARREWHTFSRTYRPVEFEAIHPANLPCAAQDHFEACTTALERLGFTPAVTCRLKPEPRPVFAQCLLALNGAVQADIAWFYGSPAVCFVSVLEDGHVLETGCVEQSLPPEEIDAINRSGYMSTQMFAAGEGGDFADEDFLLAAYRGHVDRLCELEDRRGCGTLHLSPEQIPDLKRYENAVFGQWQFDQGKVDNRPEPQPCPLARVQPVADSLTSHRLRAATIEARDLRPCVLRRKTADFSRVKTAKCLEDWDAASDRSRYVVDRLLPKWLKNKLAEYLRCFLDQGLQRSLAAGDYETVLALTARMARVLKNDVWLQHWHGLALLWLDRYQEVLEISDRMERLHAEEVVNMPDAWVIAFNELKCSALSGLEEYEELYEFTSRCLKRYPEAVSLAAFQLLATTHLGTLTASTSCLEFLDGATDCFDQAWQFVALHSAQLRIGNEKRAGEIAQLGLASFPDDAMVREIARASCTAESMPCYKRLRELRRCQPSPTETRG